MPSKSYTKSFEQAINSLLMVKILIAMIIGILIERITYLGIIIPLIGVFAAAVLVAFLYVNRRKRISHRYNYLNGLSFYALWICFGMFIVEYQSVDKPELSDFGDGVKIGVVVEPTEEKPKSFKTRIKILDSTNNNATEILAYFEKDSSHTPPQFGDLIGFGSDVRYIESNGNPLEFDYQRYMSLQGVYCQSYIKSGEYEILQPAYEKGIKYYGSKIRNKLIDIYKQSGISGQPLAVLEALTLGYKADLEPETITTFQTSGAMHILAVSGLHTGIIMMITSWLLTFLNYSQKTRIIKCALIILTLWAFAAITGFSPSVCRSALMFSLLTISEILNRHSSTYNTLAASAFILLIINPLLIFNVGFGLSYLAVLAIISIMPFLQKSLPGFDPVHDTKLVWVRKWITRYFLGIVFVSIAAQIGTSILSIRTFNLFPTYFLITNILVIPLSYFIMVMAILLLSVSWCAPLMLGVTEVLKFFLELLTSSVSWIESLPAASINDIFITNLSSIFLYAGLVMLVVFGYYRRAVQLKISLVSLCLFALSITIFDTAKNVNSQIIVYNKNNVSLSGIVNGNKMTIYTDNAKLDEYSLSPATYNAALVHANLVEICNTDSLSSIKDLFFVIDNKKFYIVKSAQQIEIMKDQTLAIDFLIVSDNTLVDANVVAEKFKCSNVIFDSSNTKKFVAARETEYLRRGISCHNVRSDGAFVFGDGDNAIWWF